MALYDDIGGAPAVRAALDVFYPRVLADDVLSPFFLGVDVARLKKTQEGYFAHALGGAPGYAGRRLADAHVRARQRGMNAAVFDRFVAIFRSVLVDLGLTGKNLSAIIAVLEATREQVL